MKQHASFFDAQISGKNKLYNRVKRQVRRKIEGTAVRAVLNRMPLSGPWLKKKEKDDAYWAKKKEQADKKGKGKTYTFFRNAPKGHRGPVENLD